MPLIFGTANIENSFFVQGGVTTELTKIYYKENLSATPILVWNKTSASWHTIFSGSNEEYIEPDGVYHEVSFANLGVVPSGAQQVRVSGSIFIFDEDSQTIDTEVSFNQAAIAEGTWTKVAEIQDANRDTSELIMGVFGNNVEAIIRGTCNSPYVHVGQITLVEAYY